MCSSNAPPRPVRSMKIQSCHSRTSTFLGRAPACRARRRDASAHRSGSQAVAAISVTGPVTRFHPETQANVVREAAATRIARRAWLAEPIWDSTGQASLVQVG